MKKLFSHPGHKVFSLIIAIVVLLSAVPISAAQDDALQNNAILAVDGVNYDSPDNDLEYDDENDIENDDSAGAGDSGDSDMEDGDGGEGGDEGENGDEGDSESDDLLDYSITRFRQLSDYVKTQTVLINTPLEDLTLPDTLEADAVSTPVATDGTTENDKAEITIDGVIWLPEPEYDPQAFGTYVFTPELPDGFTLADGVDLPVITVEIPFLGFDAVRAALPTIDSIKDERNTELKDILSPQVTQDAVVPLRYTITFTLPDGASIRSADAVTPGESIVSAAGYTITMDNVTGNISIKDFLITVVDATLETVPMWSDSNRVGVLNLFTLPNSAVRDIGGNPEITYDAGGAAPSTPGTAVAGNGGRHFFYRADTFSSQKAAYAIKNVKYTYDGIAAENDFNKSGTTPAFTSSGVYTPLKGSSPLSSGNRLVFSYNGSGPVQTAYNSSWSINKSSPWYYSVHDGSVTYRINSGLSVWVTTKQLDTTDLTELTFTIYNKSNARVSDTSISFDADVQIGDDDHANINPIDGYCGFLMANRYTPSLCFTLINANVGKYGGESAPNWWGRFGERTSHVNDDVNITTASNTGLDTGAVAKVRGITLDPGELRTYSFFIGVGDPSDISNYIDSFPPVISSGSANPVGATDADVGFSSSKAGDTYYFVRDRGTAVPSRPGDPSSATNWISASAASAGSNNFSISGLTLNARYIYVVVVDTDDNVSNMLEIPLVEEITSADITVTAPAAGDVPDFSASGTGNFTVDQASWTPATPDGKFLEGIAYTAAVTLRANSRYVFSPLLSATINGNSAMVLNNAGNSVTLSYTFAEITGDVSGTVTEGGNPAAGVTVKVMTGGSYGTQIASTTTDSNGYYSFAGLPYGVYSLVATDSSGVTVTKLIMIIAPSLTANMQMPSGNQNTYVRIVGSTPSTAADNLEDMFSEQDIDDVAAGDEVTITLVVEEVDNPSDASLVTQNLNGKKKGLYLDLKLLKTIRGKRGNDCNNEPVQPQNNATLAVTINLPPELQGQTGYSIIRVHNNRNVATIPPTYNSNLQTLAFEADLFSTYAIVYGSTPAPPDPPTPPPASLPGGSSGRKNAEYPVDLLYWIEVPEARKLAQAAQEEQQDYARSSRVTITGIRKDSLLLLAESGLRYRHDTVADNAVQVRVNVKDPGKAVKDILVSGYVAGDTVEKTKSRFERSFQNNIAVVSMDQHEPFGIPVQIAARADLRNMDTDNLYFYSYNSQSGKYAQIQTEYRIDAKGYVHFATILSGDIIISDAPLAKQGEAQAYDTSAPPAEVDLRNSGTEEDSFFSIYTGETLKLEKWDNPGAGEILDTRKALQPAQVALNDYIPRNKPNLATLVIIAVILVFASMLLFVLIPRKSDELIPIEEYRRNRRSF